MHCCGEVEVKLHIECLLLVSNFALEDRCNEPSSKKICELLAPLVKNIDQNIIQSPLTHQEQVEMPNKLVRIQYSV